MAAWCLPPDLANRFLEALRTGDLAPEKLIGMSSAERRAAFAEHVGAENAAEVNAQFESKLLLKDQQAGLVTWARKTAGLSEPARRDLVAQINKLDRVLQPEDEEAFLADLAAKKLGTAVNAEEAQEIFDLSQRAERARTVMMADIDNEANRIAYGNAYLDLRDKVESLKPHGRDWGTVAIDVLNIPKTALSTLDLSAPFVQGWGMMSTKAFWQGFGQMFRYLASEQAYRDLRAYIITHPNYEMAKSAKLGITELGDKLTAREEAIQSSLVEKASQWLSAKTGIPDLVRGSNRAFTGFLNYVRFSRFNQLIAAAKLAGEDVRPGSAAARDIARVVNDFTGRGAIGVDDAYASAVPALNAMFFSPRKTSAMIQMFNPVRYVNPRISRTARIAAMRQLTGSLVATSAVLAIAKAMGADVNMDPRSTDFAKIAIGNSKFDVTGGNATYLRLLARIATNEQITTKGKLIELGSHYGAPTRADLLLSYLRGKLSPVAGAIADALYGKTMIGQPFSVTEEMHDKLIPITMNSLIDMALNDPDNSAAILPALTGIFGIGIQSPLPPISQSGRDAWGEPVPSFGTSAEWRNDPVNRACEEVGYTPHPAPDKIRGVKLDDQQLDDFVRMSGRLSHMRLEGLIQSPGWEAIPSGIRLNLIRNAVTKSRDIAATTVMLQSQGSDNDIIAKANAAKMERLGLTPEPQTVSEPEPEPFTEDRERISTR